MNDELKGYIVIAVCFMFTMFTISYTFIRMHEIDMSIYQDKIIVQTDSAVYYIPEKNDSESNITRVNDYEQTYA